MTNQLPEYVYVASSWRNPFQEAIVALLKSAKIPHYDFKNPAPGVKGFSWSEIDPEWLAWRAKDYREALDNPIAIAGYKNDFDAMQKADTFILVLPCGRSAHLEMGWAVGAGKRTCILTHDGEEPELMAKMVDYIATDVNELLEWLGVNN